ncbi:response regulator [Pleionea mediterranea]|uniref:Response regulator receiver protein n=1 Tax=Pleionea mediterranea TaxID=523701 RepID=A0A316G0L4_9GAMM|nr:response regulator [Pleionea mediterranea]PWK53330.1 response regulator receiver protein [Pleionea mediterranea]
MTIPVTICDDSTLARKQIARSLPKNWDIDITFATNGVEGLQAVKDGKAEVLFLDLTMPEMDGYQVLEQIFHQQLNAMVIVVSGDIQKEARERVMSLGALAFIKKPADNDQISMLLEEYGLLSETTDAPNTSLQEVTNLEIPLRDSYQEIANVAMGKAAELLAQLLDTFIVLPIPSVNTIEVSDLQMALHAIESQSTVSSVCQGFIGNGVAGEALLIFNDSSFSDIAKLMRFEGTVDENVELELLMDIGSILTGAFLKTFADQLDINFSQGHPKILGRHCNIADLIHADNVTWKETLAIEIHYTIENYNVNCDLLILFSEDSIEELNHRVSFYSS